MRSLTPYDIHNVQSLARHLRTHQTQGRGTDRADCMPQLKAAWERFAADAANLTEFIAAKRRR